MAGSVTESVSVRADADVDRSTGVRTVADGGVSTGVCLHVSSVIVMDIPMFPNLG